MTPTMEEVAGWLRHAGLMESALCRTVDGAEYAKELWADRAAQVEAMGWRPIVECPKDGTFVDLWNGSSGKRLTDCRWDGNNRWVRWDENAFGVMAWCVVKGKVTHFMPCPNYR